MKCVACGVELNPGAAFCHICGAKAVDAAGATASPASVAASPVEDAASAGLRGGRRDDPEVELWQGGYSGKAMFNTYAMALLVSIAAIALGVLFPGIGWLIAGVVVVVIWTFVLGTLLYRRMNIHYRLTSQRFFHQTGILTRTTNRVEVIEMDDVTFTQTLLERFVGVGTIKIVSSDRTDPVLVMRGIANVQQVSETIDKARRKELTRRGLRIESV